MLPRNFLPPKRNFNTFIGKYFRLLCILALPTFLLYLTWGIFFMPKRLPVDGFIIGIWLFLILAVILQISYLRMSRKEKIEPNYEEWAKFFYLLVVVGLIYYFLRLLSDWISFDIIGFLKYLLEHGLVWGK